MTKYLQKCSKCKEYGLLNAKAECKLCGGTLVNPFPPKFSPIDKYAKYRIEYFKEKFK
jgi:H/ACA ribonucleoprotein complex subunit 3